MRVGLCAFYLALFFYVEREHVVCLFVNSVVLLELELAVSLNVMLWLSIHSFYVLSWLGLHRCLVNWLVYLMVTLWRAEDDNVRSCLGQSDHMGH